MEYFADLRDGRCLVALTQAEYNSFYAGSPKPVADLGKRLKAWRSAKHLSLRPAAELLGLSAGTLSRLERKQHADVRMSTLAKILKRIAA